MRIDHIPGNKYKIGLQPGDRPGQAHVLLPELLPVQVADMDDPQSRMAPGKLIHGYEKAGDLDGVVAVY